MMNLRKKSIFNKKTKTMNLNRIMIMRLRFPKERQTQKKKSKFSNKKTILNSNNEDKIWYTKLNEKNNQGLN